MASLVAQRLKCLPPMRETGVPSLGQEDPLEKGMATTDLSQPQRGARSEWRLGDRAALHESEGTCHNRDRCGGGQPRHKSK